jgi:hypothetical protein
MRVILTLMRMVSTLMRVILTIMSVIFTLMRVILTFLCVIFTLLLRGIVTVPYCVLIQHAYVKIQHACMFKIYISI